MSPEIHCRFLSDCEKQHQDTHVSLTRGLLQTIIIMELPLASPRPGCVQHKGLTGCTARAAPTSFPSPPPPGPLVTVTQSHGMVSIAMILLLQVCYINGLCHFWELDFFPHSMLFWRSRYCGYQYLAPVVLLSSLLSRLSQPSSGGTEHLIPTRP